MKFSNLKQDKGVAGLTVFLSLIVMLFVIGLLVMIFALMGGEIQDSTIIATSKDYTATHELLTTVTESGETFALGSLPEAVCNPVTAVTNATYTIISSGNYTQTACVLAFTGADTQWNDTNWRVNYTGTYAGESWNIINDTTNALGSSTDWFDIFIVIAAMVVLILLTVIIITAIRGSGLVATGESGGAGQNIGSA